MPFGLMQRQKQYDNERVGCAEGYELWEFFLKSVYVILARKSTKGERGDAWKRNDLRQDRWKNQRRVHWFIDTPAFIVSLVNWV